MTSVKPGGNLPGSAPDIKNNTLVMAYLTADFAFQQDYEIWGPLN